MYLVRGVRYIRPRDENSTDRQLKPAESRFPRLEAKEFSLANADPMRRERGRPTFKVMQRFESLLIVVHCTYMHARRIGQIKTDEQGPTLVFLYYGWSASSWREI